MSASDMRFSIWLLAIVFLFYGEPDVWDALHNKIMSMETCK